MSVCLRIAGDRFYEGGLEGLERAVTFSLAGFCGEDVDGTEVYPWRGGERFTREHASELRRLCPSQICYCC